MPIYLYQCPACELEIDKFFKSITEGQDYLPTCRCGNKMNKVIGQTSFLLKGEGWSKKTKKIIDRDNN